MNEHAMRELTDLEIEQVSGGMSVGWSWSACTSGAIGGAIAGGLGAAWTGGGALAWGAAGAIGGCIGNGLRVDF